MSSRTIASLSCIAIVASMTAPLSTPRAATTAPPGPAVGAVSAALVAREAKSRAAQDAKPTEAQRLAVAKRSGTEALDISTSSIAAMKRVQSSIQAVTSGRVSPASSVGSAASPHYFGPYGNYANSPQHLPTALVAFSAPTGTPARIAAGTAAVSDSGVVTAITVTDAGSGYTTAPTVWISGAGAGSGATATASTTRRVSALTITHGGLGYNDPVTVTFTGGGGTGATASATLDTHGTIVALQLTNPGSGYTSAPAISFSDAVGARTVVAAATASLSNVVNAVTVTNGGSGYITPGLRKFVDTLPVPGSVGVDGNNTVAKNDLGQYIPIAIPDSTTYAGSDYYEIAVVQYRERMHADLPSNGTLLRGYVQLSTSAVPGKHVALTNALLNGTTVPALLPNGQQAYAVDYPHYLGPVVDAVKNRPVRVLFRDLLPTGVSGDLFLPVDTTVMGAGAGPNGASQPNMGLGNDMQNPACGKTPKPTWCYAENRSTIHLHGGVTPWISDGTPHQWITPAGESTDYPAGVSVKNVPDMPDPGPGAQTFFYTNQQSARLLWYHDHSWGITRLNVYAGEASAYTITDPTEQALISTGTIPGATSTVPLVIEDKTFVPSQAQLSVSDPTWDTAKWGGEGNLWLPHVYMTAQNIQDPSGVNQFGRWMYGPWFWPPTTDLMVTTTTGSPLTANPYAGQCITGTDWCEPAAWSKNPVMPAESMGMEAYNDTPLVNGTAYPVLNVDPKSYRFKVLNAANDRFWNLSLYKASGTNNTEVALLAADVAAGKTDPIVEPKVDETISTPGPSWVQIGTEGGFLPTPTVIPPTTIGYITDPTVFDFGNINKHSLLLGPAERADVIVDFSKYAGQTLILYNDAPAAAPARDPRYDYYTDHADLRSTGGAAPTPEGYGPNTRTVMQIRVAATAPAAAFNMTKLNVAFEAKELGGGLVVNGVNQGGVFESSQHPILVGQGFYDQAYGTDFANTGNDGYVRMTNNSLTFNTLAKDPTTGDYSIAPNTTSMPTTSVAMHDEMGAAYDKLYGRMSGSMGVEAQAIGAGQAQNLTLYPFTQPPTEVFTGDELPAGDTAVRIATPAEYADNIQFWKITHNGVDSHPIHFHLADVQLINRVSWDGIIRLPDSNEIGWKDTVRVNPLSDTIVAFRPLVPQAPFGIDVSKRSPNPAMPADANATDAGFVPFLPDQSPWTNADGTPLDNRVIDFGWEYVWHCHILSHEEMDMMRPIKVTVTATRPDPSTVSFTNTNGFTVVWNDPTPVPADGTINASWGSPKNEIGYEVWRAPVVPGGVAGTFTQVGTALANHTTLVDPAGATAPYFYRVVAWNAAGATTSSSSLSVTPPPAPPVVTAAAGLGSVTLNWGTPVAPVAVATAASASRSATASGLVAVDGYTISSSSDNGMTWKTVTLNTRSSATSYVVTGLSDPGPYLFRVAAVIGNVVGSWTVVASTVSPKVIPRAPVHLVTTPGNARVSLVWATPGDGGMPIVRYAVYASTNGGSTWITLPAPGAARSSSYTVTGLSNGRAYRFKIAAVNAVGVGFFALSSAVTPFTKAGTVTKVVALPRVRSIVLTWRAPANGGAPIVGYQIDLRRSTSPTWTTYLRTTGGTATTRAISNLRAGIGYQFRVKAITKAGAAPASVPSVMIKPFSPPGTPSHLRGVVSSAAVHLQWSAPPSGGPRVIRYQISYSSDTGRTWVLAAATTRTGRTNATLEIDGTGDIYLFRVRAVTAWGVGGWSAWSNRLEPS
jgi:FtsP/CotA-like multicopper oxidase with cupredoxin domain